MFSGPFIGPNSPLFPQNGGIVAPNENPTPTVGFLPDYVLLFVPPGRAYQPGDYREVRCTLTTTDGLVLNGITRLGLSWIDALGGSYWTAGYDQLSADQKTLTLTFLVPFPRAGLYQFKCQIQDNPAVSAMQQTVIEEFLVIVTESESPAPPLFNPPPAPTPY